MSKNWGRTPVTIADKLHTATQTKYLVATKDGDEERLDRRPLGKVERFVDPVGNVCSLQLAGDGDAQKASSLIRQRAQFHKKGFVEFSKCPLKHGLRHSSELARKDFAKMPANLEGECKHDPKVMERRDGDLYAMPGCQHIEWLIDFRRKKEASQLAKRNASRIAQEKREAEKQDLQALQLEMVKEQVAEFKAKRNKAPAKDKAAE
jgi:hypothetical protein